MSFLKIQFNVKFAEYTDSKFTRAMYNFVWISGWWFKFCRDFVKYICIGLNSTFDTESNRDFGS